MSEPADSKGPPPAPPPGPSDADIDAILRSIEGVGGGAGSPLPAKGVGPEASPEEIAAIFSETSPAPEPAGSSSRMLPSGAVSMELPAFDVGGTALPTNAEDRIELLLDVALNVKIELGRANLSVQDIMKLGDGSVIELDKLAGDPLDVFVNDRLVARGEVLILNENFCIRVTEIVAPKERSST